MTSPTIRSRTVISASHSGQFAMCCVPPLNRLHHFRQTKTLSILHVREGRRAFYADFVVPPSFAHASQHEPRRVLTYSSLITGASGRVLLSHKTISSRSSGSFFTVCRHAGFPPRARSLDATSNRYSSPQSFYAIQL